MLNKVLELITEYGPEYDTDGFETDKSEYRVRCFGSLKTSTYREFYEASRIGEQVTDVFVVGKRDYELSMYENADGRKIRPNKIECEGRIYRIIRRFERATNSDYLVELSCAEVE